MPKPPLNAKLNAPLDAPVKAVHDVPLGLSGVFMLLHVMPAGKLVVTVALASVVQLVVVSLITMLLTVPEPMLVKVTVYSKVSPDLALLLVPGAPLAVTLRTCLVSSTGVLDTAVVAVVDKVSATPSVSYVNTACSGKL